MFDFRPEENSPGVPSRFVLNISAAVLVRSVYLQADHRGVEKTKPFLEWIVFEMEPPTQKKKSPPTDKNESIGLDPVRQWQTVDNDSGERDGTRLLDEIKSA